MNSPNGGSNVTSASTWLAWRHLRLPGIGALEVDAAGTGVQASPSTYDLLGIEASSAMSPLDTLLERILVADRDRYLQSVARAAASVEDYDCVYRICHPARGIRWIRERGQWTAARPDAPVSRTAILEDVTETHGEALVSACERSVLQSVANGAAIHRILDTVAREIDSLFSPSRTVVLLADQAGLSLRCAAAPGLSPEFIGQPLATEPAASSACGRAVRSKSLVIAVDGIDDPLWQRVSHDAAGHVVASCWALPVLDGTEAVLAVVAVYHDAARAPDPWESSVLLRMGELVRIVIEREVTDRARVAEVAQRSSALLRIAGRAARLGGWSFDVPNGPVVWSEEVCVIHDAPKGFSPTLEQAIEFYAPADRAQIQHLVSRCIETGEPYDEEFLVVSMTGRRVRVRTIGEAVYGADGHVVRIQGAFQDITEQEKARAEIASLAERLTTTLESISDGFVTLDDEWRYTFVNSRAERLIGRRRASLLGQVAWQVGDAECATVVRPVLEHAAERGEFAKLESFAHASQRWLEIRAHPGRDGVAVYLTDVTERRRNHDSLLETEERLRLLASATDDAFWDWDFSTNRLWWNDSYARLVGEIDAEQEPSIELWSSRMHSNDVDQAAAVMQAAMAGIADTWQSEYRLRKQDGTYAFVLERGHILRDEKGRAIRMVGGLTDLTGRRASELKLREQAELLDHASDAILVRDLSHRLQYLNKSARRLYGYEPDEVIGRDVTERIYVDPAAFQAATAAVVENGSWIGELMNVTRTGTKVLVDSHWTLVRDEDGQPTSILAIDTDVTERRKVAEQLQRIQRMDSLGTLASGIAHDLNNVLTPIVMSIDVLKQLVDNDAAQEMLSLIGESAMRGADMVKQVLSFSRGIDGQRRPVHVGRAVGDIVRIASETFSRDIRIDADIAADLWMIDGDATQLHQLLLNLSVNARDAMPDGGQLRFTVSNLLIDAQYAAMNVEAREGPYVKIDVEDTGCGIAPEILASIFEPFFTTKEIGEGTGLGLSTTMAIVKSHEGFIRVYSDVGVGTRFRVYLPARPGAIEPVPQERPTELPRGAGETILIVDDESAIRQIIKETLEAYGYRVMLAVDGADAVAQFAQRRGKIDLVLTDMMMPAMDGPSSVQVLLRLDPQLRIIGSSGIASMEQRVTAMGVGLADFLPKPFTAELLLVTVRRVLDR